jgi:hypothetical protein
MMPTSLQMLKLTCVIALNYTYINNITTINGEFGVA